MSFALGAILGFCLGVLCMALLFLTRASEAPTPPPADTPVEELNPPHSVVSPSEAPSAPSLRE